MTEPISIHNSKSELEKTPELIRQLGLQQLIFKNASGEAIPYCQYISGAEQPGRCSILIFLHGIGSVGDDNFLQVRIPAPPLVKYCNKYKIKAVLLFPQCPKGFKWVDVPWNAMEHAMPDEPSKHMRLAMELLNTKIHEFNADPERIFGGGISMGGYGIWDMACRMPETFASVAVICGGADIRQAQKLKAMNIYMIHGDDDPAVPVFRARSMFRALKESGNESAVYRELHGIGHNAWDPFFENEEGMNRLFSGKKT